MTDNAKKIYTIDHPWHPLTYNQCHVSCAVVNLESTGIDSVIVGTRKILCNGKLWYRWDKEAQKAFDIRCDKCYTNFNEDQMELF